MKSRTFYSKSESLPRFQSSQLIKIITTLHQNKAVLSITAPQYYT